MVTSSAPTHVPVMTREVLTLLAPARGGLFVDCTVGLGGHSAALLHGGASQLLGLDRDPAALAIAAETLSPWRDRVELVHADFRDLASVLDQRGIARIDGGLADLGVSSLQLGAARGFSFQRDEPLDMRMDPTTGPTAAQLLEDVDERELADLIYTYGEDRFSRRIARSLVRSRAVEPIRTTRQLASIVRRAIPTRGRSRLDPATRTFQAFRIWVNRELDGLDRFLLTMATRLRAGARMVVITFHSLEDRIVKQTLKALEAGGDVALHVLTRKPLVATREEVARNPGARSAKLRAAERTA